MSWSMDYPWPPSESQKHIFPPQIYDERSVENEFGMVLRTGYNCKSIGAGKLPTGRLLMAQAYR